MTGEYDPAAESMVPGEPPKRPEVDPAKLPALPPLSSKSWDRRINPRRWYVFGCSAAVVVLVVMIVTAYFGLRSKVWRTLDEMQEAVERSVLVDVPQPQRKRLEANLEAFRERVESSRDPYPAIGRFVGIAREAVVDWAVDADEVSQLNSMLEEELGGGERE